MIGRVGRRQSGRVKAATGERIVAFGRAGKRPGNPFFRPFGAAGEIAGSPETSASLQRFLKPHEVRLVVRGTSDMVLGAKKRESRKSLHQSGWITLEGGFAARQCVVQDMSTTGAKITIDDPNTLPAKLKLAFSRDARTGRKCEVVWRRGKSVGIKFVR
jgi:hypothetical protein